MVHTLQYTPVGKKKKKKLPYGTTSATSARRPSLTCFPSVAPRPSYSQLKSSPRMGICFQLRQRNTRRAKQHQNLTQEAHMPRQLFRPTDRPPAHTKAGGESRSNKTPTTPYFSDHTISTASRTRLTTLNTTLGEKLLWC